MKLRTSFFNATVLKKDITRFAPVWGLYSVALLLVLMGLSDSDAGWTASEFVSFFGSISIVQLGYGGICAALLFGDLFNPRMCNALHAMPLRREGWFLTHLTAGLLFFLVPTGIFSGLMMLLIGRFWYLALIYYAVSFLMFLFFFGVGAFSAMCAGNRLAMIALYGIINFFSVFVMCMAYVFYEPFLYGIELDSANFFHYSPALALSGCQFVDFQPSWNEWPPDFMGFYADECTYLGWTVLAGLVFLALALVIYRCRDLETAGDFVSAKPAAPFFLVIYCLSAGMLLYIFGDIFGGDLEYIFLSVGIVVGFFTGKMLLERTVKVFRPKAFLGFALLVVTLLLSIGAVQLDVFGIIRRVPQIDQVKSVSISPSYGWGNSVDLEEAEDIRTVLDIHAQAIQERNLIEDTTRIHLVYEMKNGTKMERVYDIPVNTSEGAFLKKHFSSWQCVFGTEDWEAVIKGVDRIYTDKEKELPREAYPELLEAIRLDCDAGNMSQEYGFHGSEEVLCWMDISCSQDDRNLEYRYINLHIFESCENTLRVLDKYLT